MLKARIGFLLAFAVVVAACGTPPPGGADPPEATEPPPSTTTTVAPTTTTTTPSAEDALALVRDALEATSKVESGRLESMTEVNLDPSYFGYAELITRTSVTFDHRTASYSYRADFEYSGAQDESTLDYYSQLGPFEYRLIGDRFYLRSGWLTPSHGAETWTAFDVDDPDATELISIASATKDPRLLLAAYRDAVVSAEWIGHEVVDDVETVHFQASIDYEAMEQALAGSTSGLAYESSGLHVSAMDLWLSVGGLVVRMDAEFAAADSAETPFNWGRSRYDLFDLGGDVEVEPPPANLVVDLHALEDEWIEVGEVVDIVEPDERFVFVVQLVDCGDACVPTDEALIVERVSIETSGDASEATAAAVLECISVTEGIRATNIDAAYINPPIDQWADVSGGVDCIIVSTDDVDLSWLSPIVEG